MLPPAEARTVIKRDGSKQVFDKTKIAKRLKALTDGLNTEYVTVDEVIEKVASGLYGGMFKF